MKRLNDNSLTILDTQISLANKVVLEVGCGDGSKSVELAKLCSKLTAIDPDSAAIATARQSHSANNLMYEVGKAEKLPFQDSSFYAVIFSLSFHHVPADLMEKAIQEAVRVSTPSGKIAFIEPTFVGTFFQAKLQFWASDGDERKEKAAAYFTMLNSHLLHEENETFDTVTFDFESDEDFIKSMEPTKNLEHIHDFLTKYNYSVQAERRINVFTVI